MTGEHHFWHPDRHADRRPLLTARGRIKAALRAWLDSQGFTEVEPSCLQVSPGNEAHLHAFETELRNENGHASRLYLHTSPEFAMKKLLSAGEQKIFSFAPVFRNCERGPLHSPEFTMLEWYRVGEPYEHLMQDCSRFVEIAAAATGRPSLSWRDRSCAAGRLQTTSVSEAFRRHAGIELDATMAADGAPDLERMRAAVDGIGLRVGHDDTWSDLFSRVLAARIEPQLGSGLPEILYGYPTHEAALARPMPGDRRFAERFELYCCGVELANGFGELTDANEQRRRFQAEMDEKERIYGLRYPLDEDFLSALTSMPDASGCALGFDRLVMLATGASNIQQVLWTPVTVRGT